ncbi:hypothetical protein XA68_10535 [Ophiocordyceps unilateralis]|uniref:J domain-containing protein n=1 Tax=Ophiocordyceps unilateralis TaxID=268505 RepID=A0A2A9PII8_OPHUN|nr:hypothetical protein XA68_10535 [Ophiocordyceps unilateralis]
MSDLPPSPKRRHILSSINPSRPRRQSSDKSWLKGERRPSIESEAAGPQAVNTEKEDVPDRLRPRPTRIRLKKHGTSPQPTVGPRHRRRRHRRHRHRSSSPSAHDIPGPPPLDPDAAFRESLFDAMADDEAASYWEGVYGQPIHVYSNEKVGPQGELERMTDDEYAAYVRQKMYEKTHAGMLEEKARVEGRLKEKEREARERRRQRKESARHSQKLQEEMERSLRRGEARRQRKAWTRLWTDYVDAWATWDGDVAKLPWPMEEPKRRDINEADVRAFFVLGMDLEAIGTRVFAARLKEERVRWHPDKVQQRLGGRVDSDVMRDVTAVFQIIDGIWGEMRDKQAETDMTRH